MTEKIEANKFDDVTRMLRARIVSLTDEMDGKSKDGRTAFSVALRAMTCAHAAEMAGDSSTVQWCREILSSCIAARTIDRAAKTTSETEIRKSLEGAISSVRRKGLSITPSNASK